MHVRASSQCTLAPGNATRQRGFRAPTTRYVVTLPARYFLDFLAAELPGFVGDARRFPDDADPFENALRAGGWPEPAALCRDPHLALLALDWWAHELLLRWFGDGEPADAPGFVMNTIDSVGFEGGDPRIEGLARAAGIPVRYQDV